MFYISAQVLPREDGSWWVVLTKRDTRSVQGIPRVVGRSIHIEAQRFRGMDLEAVAAALGAFAAVEDGHAPRSAPAEAEYADVPLPGLA